MITVHKIISLSNIHLWFYMSVYSRLILHAICTDTSDIAILKHTNIITNTIEEEVKLCKSTTIPTLAHCQNCNAAFCQNITTFHFNILRIVEQNNRKVILHSIKKDFTIILVSQILFQIKSWWRKIDVQKANFTCKQNQQQLLSSEAI